MTRAQEICDRNKTKLRAIKAAIEKVIKGDGTFTCADVAKKAKRYTADEVAGHLRYMGGFEYRKSGIWARSIA